MSNRIFKIGGGAIAAGAAYYLYQAGGDPKAAEKRFEADAAKLNNKMEQPVTPKSTQVEKDAQVYKADAEAKFSKFSEQAKDQAEKAEGRLSEYKHSAEKKLAEFNKDAPKELNKAVDAFDKNVQKGTAEAKSGISSWFGGGK